MKDEIKDLKCLGALGNLQSFAIDGTKGSKIVDINVNIVKDYIINLQESEAYYYGQYKDYKLRNEKAIEKIKKIQENAIKYGAVHDASICQDLLNILNGGDE